MAGLLDVAEPVGFDDVAQLDVHDQPERSELGVELFYYEVASRIYVPAGLTLVPAVSPAVLQDLVRDRGDGYVFFDAEQAEPRVVASSAFGPVSRRVLRDIAAIPIGAERPAEDAAPLPLFRYDKPRRFPLWGIPGKKSKPDQEES